MKRSTAQVGRQMEMLPLEEWIEAERKRSNAMRPLGEITAGIVEKMGGRTGTMPGGTRPPHAGGADHETPAIEKGAGRPHEGGGGREASPTERQGRALAIRSAVVVFLMEREPVHVTGSGDDVWIPF